MSSDLVVIFAVTWYKKSVSNRVLGTSCTEALICDMFICLQIIRNFLSCNDPLGVIDVRKNKQLQLSLGAVGTTIWVLKSKLRITF